VTQWSSQGGKGRWRGWYVKVISNNVDNFLHEAVLGAFLLVVPVFDDINHLVRRWTH
jgi:hypothetical protein